eukprot:gene11696-34422_t
MTPSKIQPAQPRPIKRNGFFALYRQLLNEISGLRAVLRLGRNRIMQILCNQKVTPRIPFNKTKALFAPLPRLGRFVSTRSQIVQAVEEAKEGAPVTTGAGEYQWTFQCTDGPEVGAKGGRGRIIKELPTAHLLVIMTELWKVAGEKAQVYSIVGLGTVS